MARRVANTKHFKISKLLSEKVRLMSPGDMLPTIDELKSKYKCSQATITQALDRLRIRGLIERPSGKMRLVVAQYGVSPRFQLNLMRPLWPSPDFDSITNRVYEMGLKEHFGFGLHVYSDGKHLNVEQALKNADAGLIIGDRSISEAQVEAINGSRKPIVFLREKPKEVLRAGSVWVDDEVVGKMATKHLLDLGHKRIAVMLSEPVNPSSTTRLEGWRLAMAKAKIPNLDSLIVDCSVPSGTEAIGGSYRLLSKWLDSHPLDFTAIFCVGWTGAIAALHAFRERGIKVPEQMSVITYASESPLCNYSAPPLTTLQIDLDRYTREALRIVEESLAASSDIARNVMIKPELVVRESTAKPRK